MSYLQSNNKKELIIKSIVLPLGVGLLAALLTKPAMQSFAMINKPQLSPPAIIFPVVWSILYTLMGVGSYLVITSDGNEEDIQKAIKVYLLQLGVNFLWTSFFFNFQWYVFSFVWLVLLWILVCIMLVDFSKISKIAAYINIPYIIWLTFAAYLNLGIFLLN